MAIDLERDWPLLEPLTFRFLQDLARRIDDRKIRPFVIKEPKPARAPYKGLQMGIGVRGARENPITIGIELREWMGAPEAAAWLFTGSQLWVWGKGYRHSEVLWHKTSDYFKTADKLYEQLEMWHVGMFVAIAQRVTKALQRERKSGVENWIPDVKDWIPPQ